MNKKQKVCILVGILLLTICFLFPPWYYDSATLKMSLRGRLPAGYSSILNKPEPPQITGEILEQLPGLQNLTIFYGPHIHVSLLATQGFFIFIITHLLVKLFSFRKV